MGLKRFISPKKITKGVTKGIADLHTRTAELTTSEEFRKDFKEKIRDKDKSLLITAPYETWKKKPLSQTTSKITPLATFGINMPQAVPLAEGGEINEQMVDMMNEETPTHTMPDGTEMPGATHEEYEEMMIPDEQMEDDYTDFIIGESLTPEDEEYLLNALEQDDRLSMIFDQVVETASEFSGSGPVEGPGNERSDSIPARLSDGEFVMTAKAANEIGPDNLQGMMEQAEVEADDRERRIMKAGGYVEEEEENEEQEIVRAIQSKEAAGRVMPTSLADKKVNESMIALNPRNSLFAT